MAEGANSPPNAVIIAGFNGRRTQSMKNRLFVIHGYQAHPQSHWFQWLCQQFPDTQCQVIALPHSDCPQVDAWQQALQHAIGQVDEHTFLVAHSLGCVTTLRYLTLLGRGSANVGALALVAGFTEKLPNLPQLDAFNDSPLDWQLLRGIERKLVLLSEDDSVVAPAATAHLSGVWQAPLLRLQGRGHFTSQDGCHTLPELAAWLREHM